MQVISTDRAPGAIGPYSQAIVANGFVFCSGQIALDPATGRVDAVTVADQTRQVLKNLAAVLEAAGSSIGSVVKCTVFLRSMDDFPAMNEVYSSVFVQPKPARSTVAVVGLPRDVKVEIEAIAVVAR
jgi:2-iminobutanoate/2-iminopropanoate deaminase